MRPARRTAPLPPSPPQPAAAPVVASGGARGAPWPPSPPPAAAPCAPSPLAPWAPLPPSGPLTAGGIQTTLTVAAGTPVLVDFWYQAQGVTNSFSADLGTTNLIALTNDTSHTSWTEFTFTVPAPSDNPTLSFTFTNPPDYTYFDDVRVCIQQAAACYANCDHSTTQPCLNVLDFGCFLNQFAAGATYANCDNSTTPPVLNVLDFGCFLNKFAAGCSNC